jgi:hypothetical protein
MPTNAVIEKLIKEKLPLTVTNFIVFAFWDESSLDELEGEDLCEVLEMIEDGLLVDTESGAIN